jgi:choline dehydrogenase-like flavoprotein
MAENGLSVLLLERGGEQVYNSQQLMTGMQALTDDCAESIRSTPGHTVTTGNCMGGTYTFTRRTEEGGPSSSFPCSINNHFTQLFSGIKWVGATSVNHGIYVQEEPEWVYNYTKMYGNATLTVSEIIDAYDWVRHCFL